MRDFKYMPFSAYNFYTEIDILGMQHIPETALSATEVFD